MVTESSELKRDFLLAREDTTVAEVREKLEALGNLWLYVAVLLNGRGYAVFRLGELIETLKSTEPAFRPELLARPLKDVRSLLAERSASAVEEQALSPGEVRRLFRDAPRGRWVVLKDGEVTGVLVGETRSASSGMDLGWLHAAPERAATMTRGSRRAAPPPPSAAAPPPPSFAPPQRSRVLSAADRPPAMAPPPPAAPAEKAEKAAPPPPTRSTPKMESEGPAAEPAEKPRWINAQLEGRDPAEPLRVDETCTIAFDVDMEIRPGTSGHGELMLQFPKGEDVIELTVQLSSEDFDVLTEPQKLRVPRRGKSENKARFDIRAKREGAGILQAVFLRGGNFVQLVTVRLAVGAPLRSETLTPTSRGRTIDSSAALQPRDVTLVLTKTADGFQAILAGAVKAIATLPITLPQLDQMIAQARQELQGVVDLVSGPGNSVVYQEGIDIPKDASDTALKAVAKAGFRLYQQIFSGPGADAESRLLGAKFRKMAQKEPLKIQILSEQFLLPWGILYMADSFDPDHIDPELFLGFKHIIEHIPLQPPMDVLTTNIDGPLSSVSLNINADIDQQMGIPVIAGQLEYWKAVSQKVSTKLIVRKTGEEVKRALADPSSPDQVLYFYCHAESKSLSEGGGPDTSALVFTGDDGRLTLGDLSVFAPIGNALSGAPLVFINACESAEMSALFYDGFV
ncbi:MAG: CHAT domain-containing protein, partial [Acidobacteriota bacterium]|nr:CHAT domain-containing protein [Acidobacteriota bacterium]